MASLKPNKERKYHVIHGTCPAFEVVVYQDDIRSMERALLERLFFVEENGKFVRPPRPEGGYFEAETAEFYKKFKSFIPHVLPITTQQFVDCYSGKKRQQYQVAADSLLREPIVEADSHIRGFQKVQKENLTLKPDGAPRWISPRSYRYIVQLGVYIKPLEKRLYKALNTFFGATVVAKGLNARDRGKAFEEAWTRFSNPCAIPMDTSRFEQCVGIDALKFEHKIYRYAFPRDKTLALLLCWQIFNRGGAKSWNGFLSFVCEGVRMSGDDNTALGNTLITLALVWVWAEKSEVSIIPIADGDDSVVVLDYSDHKRFLSGCKEWYRTMGFRMKIEALVRELEHIDFCQCRPVWTPDGYIMVREVNAGISKDSVSMTRFNHEKDMKAWFAAVGKGGISLTGGIPVYQAFYEMYIRNSKGAKPMKQYIENEAYKHYKFLGMERTVQEVHPRTRYSFWLAFGLTDADQQSLEDYYRNLDIDYVRGEVERKQYGDLPWAR